METKYIIVKSAGDDYSFTTWPIYDGTVTVGHTEEYAKLLAERVTATMKIVPELVAELENALNIIAWAASGAGHYKETVESEGFKKAIAVVTKAKGQS